MKLNQFFDCQEDVEITSLAIDSRKVQPGSLFFCLEGFSADGHAFADKAVDAGAVAIVHGKPLPKRPGVVYIQVQNPRWEASRVCDIFYGHPSDHLYLFGVTGTNGKTTMMSAVSYIYGKKKPCGYMGTIAVRFGDVDRLPSLTTPDQIEMHDDLSQMVAAGMEAAAIEVSSQGLSTGRVDSVDFDCVAFTNLTHDHLDFHKTMAGYFEAKSLLFRRMKPSGVAVLNADDEPSIGTLLEVTPCKTVTYGIQGRTAEAYQKAGRGPVDYVASEIVHLPRGTRFTLTLSNGETYPIETNLVADFNVYNMLGAIACMHQAGMAIEEMLPAIKTLPQVDGRMEMVDQGQDFTVIADFAHTPDGYIKMFEYAKSILRPGSKILAVISSSGRRDHSKRPEMGRIAAQYADQVILSTHDPRDEDPEDIAKEMMIGFQGSACQYTFVRDRIQAIDQIISQANNGDVVLLLGKGDEPYMYVAEGRVPYIGDQNAALQALQRRGFGR